MFASKAVPLFHIIKMQNFNLEDKKYMGSNSNHIRSTDPKVSLIETEIIVFILKPNRLEKKFSIHRKHHFLNQVKLWLLLYSKPYMYIFRATDNFGSIWVFNPIKIESAG